MDSILQTIKKMLGPDVSCNIFDTDIIVHINSAFSTLNQLGVGPSDGFVIADGTATWSDFIPDKKNIEFVKSYVYLKVRLIFDPPSSSAVLTAIEKQISELEWRINVAVDPVSTSH